MGIPRKTSRKGRRTGRPAAALLALAAALVALGGAPPASAALAAPAAKECAFPPTAEGEPWDAFWAQRMTGADLMRGEIAASGAALQSLPDGLAQVWDGDDGDRHGELVSQVVAGPSLSAVVPADRPAFYRNVPWASEIAAGFELLHWQCSSGRQCPAYLNLSLGREFGPAGPDRISEIAGMGVTMVFAAGNEGAPVERTEREAALGGAFLLVASLAPDGRPSVFTDYGDAIAVAAPADFAMLSHDFDGVPRDFGGTSGAASLVTGALVGYTLLSGHRLAGPGEARLLLSRTALPVPRFPDGHLLGAGILNAHGMAAVARRVRERCGGGGGPGSGGLAGCASRLLRDPATYRFEEEAARLLAGAWASGAFPECFPGASAAAASAAAASAGAGPSCGRAAEAFDDLRRASLLAPRRPEAWEALVCVRERRFPKGGDAHTDFLRAQAARARGEEGDLARDLCAGREDPWMARYLPDASLAALVAREGCRRRPEILRVALYSLSRGADAWMSDPKALLRARP